MIAVLALIAIMFWTVGIAGLIEWFMRQCELRSLAEIRAQQMVAQAQAEFPPHSRVRHACMAAMTQPVAEVRR